MRTFHSPYYATALVTLLLRPEEGLSRYLSLALLFTSLTVLTKTKGLALALVVFLATALAAWLLHERSIRSLWRHTQSYLSCRLAASRLSVLTGFDKRPDLLQAQPFFVRHR